MLLPLVVTNCGHVTACRRLATAARSLSELAVQMAEALAQPNGGPSWLHEQIEAGCTALSSCMQLACYVPRLSAQAAFKLGAACSLVLGPGRAALAACLAAATAYPAQDALYDLADAVGFQLSAVTITLVGVLHPQHQPQAAAAFASSTAKPAVLLPWLAALTDAMPLALSGADQGGRG